MRLLMAGAAVLGGTMCGMTPRALNSDVFRGCLPENQVLVSMAPHAHLGFDVLAVCNVQNLVGRMALEAVLLHHILTMWPVALNTLRHIAMFGMVAGMAIEFRVLGDVCFHFPVQFRMAHIAAMLQGAVRRDIFGCVGFTMTIGASGQLGAMNLVVA